MKIKTSIFIDRQIWRSIKKDAVDRDMPVGDFIVMLYTRWKGGELC
jgi:hypothetical protein